VEISLALALLGGLVLIATRWHGVSMFSPWTLYTLGQFFTLSVAYLKLDPLMTDFSVVTWAVWAGSAVAFFAGNLAATLVPQSTLKPIQLVRVRSWWLWLWGVVGLYLFGTAMGLLKVGTWPVLARHPEDARLAFQQTAFSTGLLQLSNWVLVAVLPLQAIMSRGWRRWLCCGLFLLAFCYGLLTGFRMILMFGLFSTLMTWDFFVHRVAVFKLALALFAFLLLSTVVMLMRMEGTHLMRPGILHLGGEIFVKGAYIYIANNFWNLDFAVSRQLGDHFHPQTWGGLFFQPPLMVLGIASKIEPAYGWDTWRNDLSVKRAALNTISFQWTVIKEWGWPGVVLFPFGLGAFATRLYMRVERARSQWAMLIYVPVAFSILFSFFLFMYQTPMYWMIGVCYFSLWLVTRESLPRPASGEI